MLLSEDKITEIYCLADASSISTLNSSAGRIQAAPDHQREGRNPLLHVHSCRHRRPRAAEVHGLRQGDLREAGRRQGLHIKRAVPGTVRRWHPADNQGEEQHEELPDERLRQDTASSLKCLLSLLSIIPTTN